MVMWCGLTLGGDDGRPVRFCVAVPDEQFSRQLVVAVCGMFGGLMLLLSRCLSGGQTALMGLILQGMVSFGISVRCFIVKSVDSVQCDGHVC